MTKTLLHSQEVTANAEVNKQNDVEVSLFRFKFWHCEGTFLRLPYNF